ncbi:class I SAM-dependent methyltransferase [Mycoplasmatota bacterium]|nr:class I SAM-dependent methyltransferase [Mycoplasmatota bacterium]
MNINALLLLENVQLKWLAKFKDEKQLSIILKTSPHILWFMKNKCPEIAELLDNVLLKYKNDKILIGEELRKIEIAFLESLEDWIIYVTEPEAYDKQSFNRWDDNELLELIDFSNKTVLDIGAGTGSQTFRIAPLAKTVFAVEPIGNLREYIKNKSKQSGLENIYTIDGLITDIPFPENFADVLVTGHVFGDEPIKEYNEMNRVVKPGGMLILIPGNIDRDNDTHNYLLSKGFSWSSFEEPGPDFGSGWRRKYWKIK